MVKGRIYYAIALVLCLMACTHANACIKTITITERTPAASLFKQEGVTYVIKGRVDLRGKTYVLPDNCTLSFKNGTLVNGKLTGSETLVRQVKRGSLGVILQGSWVLENILDSYFDDNYLSDNQIISNINALQNDDVDNKIFIERPQYNCDIPKNDGCLIKVANNTQLKLRTIISINGNDFTSYNIIRIRNKENVEIEGGKIIGDVGKHKYVDNNSSQWGHGISIYNSKNVIISNIEIGRCIGDGIAISGDREEHVGDYKFASKDITLKNITCQYNRRQGLSIIHADGVKVQNCNFLDTGCIEKHTPSAGIDIEPNSNQTVRNVIISNCVMRGNVGYSFLTYNYVRFGDNTSVNNILVSGCRCDGQVVLHTGGVVIDRTKMTQISIVSNKEPVIGVNVKDCTISDGEGVLFHCPKQGQDNTAMISDVLFENCNIGSSDIIRKKEKALISCSGNPKRIRNVLFNNCKLSCSMNSTTKLDLISEDIEGTSFKQCDINMNN